MKMKTREVHETVHSVVLDQAAIHEILSDHLAKAAGVSLHSDGVSVRRCYVTSRDSSTGHYAEAVIEIVIDHRMQAQAQAQAQVEQG